MTEMLGTFALSVGAAVRRTLSPCGYEEEERKDSWLIEFGNWDGCLQVGMEFWAQWAHKALWHSSLWHMHESHHRPRDGPFELNDVFAIINSGPAIALLAYGFFHRGFVPGLCFGAVS